MKVVEQQMITGIHINELLMKEYLKGNPPTFCIKQTAIQKGLKKEN